MAPCALGVVQCRQVFVESNRCRAVADYAVCWRMRHDAARESAMTRYIDLLKRRRGLRRLWLAGIVSQLGDWMSYVAISLLAIEKGEGAIDVALVLVLHTLPHAVLSPVSGALADRMDRRKVMLVGALLASAVTALMACAAHVNWLLGVQALLLVRASVEALVEPGRTAAVSQLVEKQELVTAHALLATSWSVMFTLGMALGGLLAMVGIGFAIGLDALTFTVVAVIVVGLPALPPATADDSQEPGSKSKPERVRMTTALSTAWRVSGQVHGLREAVFAKAPLAIASGGTWLLLNMDGDKALGVAKVALALGILHSVRGVGTGLGPILAEAWLSGRGDRAKAQARVLRLCHVVSLLGGALFILADQSPALALFAMLLWGMGSGGNWVLSTARVQEISPPQVLGRMVALDELAMMSGMCIAVVGAGWLVDEGMRLQDAGWLWLFLGALASLVVLLGWRPGSSVGTSAQRPDAAT